MKVMNTLRSARAKRVIALLAALAGMAKAFGLFPETAAQIAALLKLLLML